MDNKKATNATEVSAEEKSTDKSQSRGSRRPAKHKGSSKKNFKPRNKLVKGDRDNDPNWYFSNAELAAQAAELSFQSIVGVGKVLDQYEAPTIYTIKYNPCPGVTYVKRTPTGADYVGNDGINVMCQKLYTLLSSRSGRTSAYAPQDLGMMILAIGEVAAISEHIRRFFGISMNYNPRNRKLPLGLLAAAGLSNPEHFIANLADARMRFNIEMTRINQIPLLDNIGYIRKCREMYQNVYMDTPSAMAQYIIPAPNSTWILNESDFEQGTFLETKNLDYVNWTIWDWIEMLHEMITELVNSTTLNVIYSDMINLASKINVPFWHFDYLSESFAVLPVYDRNFMLQLHNTDIIGAPQLMQNINGTVTNVHKKIILVSSAYFDGYVTSDNDVFPNVNANSIVYNPVWKRDSNTSITTGVDPLLAKQTLLDFDTDAPTLEDRIEALRYSVSWSENTVAVPAQGSGNTLTQNFLYALPDHYAVSMAVYANSNNVKGVIIRNRYSDLNLTDVAWLSQLNFGPVFYKVTMSSGVSIVNSIVGDLNFWTTVDYSYIERLNRIIYVGLFDYRL